MAQTPPSRPRRPAFDDVSKLTRPVPEVYDDWRGVDADVFSTRWFGEPVHVVTDPGVVVEVLTDPDRFRQDFQLGADLFDTDLDPVELFDRVGNFLQESDERDRSDRRRAAPALSRPRVDDHFGTVLDEIDASVADWRRGSVVDAQEWATSVALRTTLRGLFGVEGDELDTFQRRFERLLGLIERVTHAGFPLFLPWWLPTATKLRLVGAIRGLSKPAGRILDERTPDPEGDLLGRWLAAERDADLERSDVLAHLFVFGIAGFVTTRVVLATLLRYYAVDPDLARRIRAEARALPGSPTGPQVRDLEVTNRALDEVLRLHPPVHRIRRVAAERTTVGGYELPAGGAVLIPVWTLHRSPDHWAAPDEFRPGRWTDRETPPAYLPFGRGPHACIGRELARTEAAGALATVARRFRLAPVEQTGPGFEFHASVTMTEGRRLRVVGVDGRPADARGSAADHAPGGDR